MPSLLIFLLILLLTPLAAGTAWAQPPYKAQPPDTAKPPEKAHPGAVHAGSTHATSAHPASASPAALQPFSAEDLMRLKRISDPQVSPDGRYLAYVLRETDIEADAGRTDIWLLDLAHKEARPRRLTTHPANDVSPRWAPDSRTIYFLSSRSGISQVWRLSLDGGEASRVTEYPLSIGALKVAPNGNYIALTMAVFPDCADLRCTQEQLAARARTKATGRLYNQLFIRHWDTWSDGTRSHLFAARINADGRADTPVDLSRSLDADVPSKPFGGDEDFAFSPDSSRLVFSARIAGRTEPWSTNFDLFEVPVDRSGQPKNLTAANQAWDARPVFLRNGDLAWLAMD
ncbi:MAG: PD40 domain-containing protein, partial [Sinobacteraceae bacterium]|nr:PD40 domain-containing protein [Nevskiaceae bacterium]